MNKAIRLGAAFLAVSVLPACATVVRGTKTTYNITSSPSEAEVALSTGSKCVTPCKLKLKRKDGFTATVAKKGFKTETATVESKISGGGGVAAAGNILAGGIIGGIVDGTNGSLNSFYPGKLHVELKPEDATAVPVAATGAAEPVAAAPAEPVAAQAPTAAVETAPAAMPVEVASAAPSA